MLARERMCCPLRVSFWTGQFGEGQLGGADRLGIAWPELNLHTIITNMGFEIYSCYPDSATTRKQKSATPRSWQEHSRT